MSLAYSSCGYSDEKLRFSERTTHGHRDILRKTGRTSLRSGSLPSIKMMQSANFWNCDHLAKRERLDRSGDRRIFFKRQMRAATFVSSQNSVAEFDATICYSTP